MHELVMGIGSHCGGWRPPATTTQGFESSELPFVSTAAVRRMSKVTPQRAPLGVIHQTDQLTGVGQATQIDHAPRWRMIMVQLSDLYKLNAPVEMVDHPLIPGTLPPFGCAIELASGGDHPKRNLFSDSFLDVRYPGLSLG
jgi:hypothetical protein